MAVADESYSRTRIKRLAERREKNSRRNGNIPQKKGDLADLGSIKSVSNRKNLTHNNVLDAQSTNATSGQVNATDRQPRQYNPYYNPYYASSNNYGSFRPDSRNRLCPTLII